VGVGECEGSPCTADSHLCEGEGFELRRVTQLGSSLTHTLRAATPSEQQVHSKVSPRRAVDTVQRGWSGVCSNRPSEGLEKRTTGEQPASLAVEGAEESLSILSDYTPTARPPPKRC
jgi:hypothetical protein